MTASAALGRKTDYIITSVTKMGLGGDNRVVAGARPAGTAAAAFYNRSKLLSFL
jgi:hypothetical protein